MPQTTRRQPLTAKTVSKTSSGADTLEDPLEQSTARRDERIASRTTKKFEKYRKSVREYMKDHDDSTEVTHQRIDANLGLVVDYQRVPKGRSRRLRMLTSALTDAPAEAMSAPSFDKAIARLTDSAANGHPEAKAGLAGLALAKVGAEHADLQAKLLKRLHAAHVHSTLVAPHPQSVLPADVLRTIGDFLTSPQGLAEEVVGRHATPYRDRHPQRGRTETVFGGGVGGLVGGVVAGMTLGAIAGPVGSAIGGLLGGITGIAPGALGGELAYRTVRAPARLVRNVRRRFRDRALDREFADRR